MPDVAPRSTPPSSLRAALPRTRQHEWVMERINSALKRGEGTGLSFADVQIIAEIWDAAENVLRAAGEGYIESHGLGSDAPLRVLRAALYGSVPMEEEDE